MRRYFAWALGAMALFSSCKMYDNLPEGDDKPALYLTKEMGKLTDLLTGNANGWRLVLLPGSYQYGGINIAFKFHKGGAVESYSEDLDEVIHSSYRIYNTAGIRLTFDTRNPALGRYAEPRNTLLQGLEGDFEFTFGDVSADQDTIQLTGVYSRNKMMLVRLKEDAETYIHKVKDIRNAVYGKALATTTIGGQEVKMSVFGLIRQLQVKVGSAEPRLIPINFSPEGIEVIGADDLIDDSDASQGKVGQIGTEILRQIKVVKEGSTYHALSPSGQKIAIQSTDYDFTKSKVRAFFYEYWCGDAVRDVINRINGVKYQSGPNAGQDSIVGDAVNDAYYTSPLDEIAYIGRTDGGDHKISLRRGGNWLSYYLDFAPASDDPSTIYIRKFVQNGDNWRYHRYAMQRMINAIADNSPYKISVEHYNGNDEYRITSVANDKFWMSTSKFYEPGHAIDQMPVYLNGHSF